MYSDGLLRQRGFPKVLGNKGTSSFSSNERGILFWINLKEQGISLLLLQPFAKKLKEQFCPRI